MHVDASVRGSGIFERYFWSVAGVIPRASAPTFTGKIISP